MNTGAGAHNNLAAYRSEDPRIDTVRWKALRGNASYTAPFAGGWQWSVRGGWQYSPDALISGEQFGLGGIDSVRGTEIDRPVSGDKGLSATLEVSTPELLTGLRLLAFLDAGWVANHDATPARPATDHIASRGIGLRWGGPWWTVSADYGRIANGSRIPLAVNTYAPRRGDERLYVSVGLRF